MRSLFGGFWTRQHIYIYIYFLITVRFCTQLWTNACCIQLHVLNLCCIFAMSFYNLAMYLTQPRIDWTNCEKNPLSWLIHSLHMVTVCCGLRFVRKKSIFLALQMKTESKEMQEKVTALETEAEELRRIRKMLESKLYEPGTVCFFFVFFPLNKAGTWVNSQLSFHIM